jgi:hypothetical protein
LKKFRFIFVEKICSISGWFMYLLRRVYSAISIQRSPRFCSVTVNIPSPSNVLNLSQPSLRVLRTNNAKDVLERSRTLNDVGRFRTPKDGTVTGWSRSQKKNADSAVWSYFYTSIFHLFFLRFITTWKIYFYFKN